MSPEAFAERCRVITSAMRGHEAHRALDLLTNDALRELGYGEGIEIFETAVAHWHSPADPYPYPTRCPDCDSGSRAERQDPEEGLGPEDGRAAEGIAQTKAQP